MFDLSTNITRFAFIFLIYAVITSGYISEILSCQMQNFLMTSLFGRHILAIIMCFAFIMLEGGWDFDKDEEGLAPTNWASGNTIHTLVIAFVIYIIFLISSKSKLVPNLIFFSAMFVLYVINTYRSYLHVRKRITDETNEKVLYVEKIIATISVIVLVYGFIDYYLYQKSEYKGDFSLTKFIFGAQRCSSLGVRHKI